MIIFALVAVAAGVFIALIRKRVLAKMVVVVVVCWSLLFTETFSVLQVERLQRRATRRAAREAKRAGRSTTSLRIERHSDDEFENVEEEGNELQELSDRTG